MIPSSLAPFSKKLEVASQKSALLHIPGRFVGELIAIMMMAMIVISLDPCSSGGIPIL